MKNKKLLKEIEAHEREIAELEYKRSRSLASLVDALVDKRDPNGTDVQYFKSFTAQIEVKRERLQALTEQAKGKL